MEGWQEALGSTLPGVLVFGVLLSRYRVLRHSCQCAHVAMPCFTASLIAGHEAAALRCWSPAQT